MSRVDVVGVLTGLRRLFAEHVRRELRSVEVREYETLEQRAEEVPSSEAVVVLLDHARTTSSRVGDIEAATAVVALEEPTAEDVSLLLSSGAAAVIDLNDDLVPAIAAIALTARGYAVVPRRAAARLGSAARSAYAGHTHLADAEVAWLRALAVGDKVTTLARRAGRSERTMYRVLDSLYRRIGVTGRAEAVLWALRAGLLAEDGSGT